MKDDRLLSLNILVSSIKKTSKIKNYVFKKEQEEKQLNVLLRAISLLAFFLLLIFIFCRPFYAMLF